MGFIILLILVIVLLFALGYFLKEPDDKYLKSDKKIAKVWLKIKHGLKWFNQEFIKFPLYLQSHPVDGFDRFKRDKKAKMSVAIIYVFLMVVVQVARYQFTGFTVKAYDVNKLNALLEAAYVIAPVLALTVSNWSLTTLFDGKGTMKEIFMLIGYSLMPLFWTRVFALIASNFITSDQMAIYTLLNGIGIFLTVYMLFMGLMSIHEYGVLKCIGSILGTIVALLVICFAGILVFDLVQKMWGFIYTIYEELTLRYF